MTKDKNARFDSAGLRGASKEAARETRRLAKAFDTLPSPVTLSTPERLRDALERYGQHEEGCNYFADPERLTLCDCGYEAALIDAIPSPVSVPEGDARARPLAEWHEDIGPVLWWFFPISEPPYVGTPNDLGQTVEFTLRAHRVDKLMRANVGGWPGYHTHWTPLPALPAPPSLSSPEEG